MHNTGTVDLAHVTYFGELRQYTLGNGSRGVSSTGVHDLSDRLVDHQHVFIDMQEIECDRGVGGDFILRIQDRIVDIQLLACSNPSRCFGDRHSVEGDQTSRYCIGRCGSRQSKEHCKDPVDSLGVEWFGDQFTHENSIMRP